MRLILLVEDDPSMQEVITDILTSQGYAVITVSDGRAALRALDQASPDLILLDIYLPIQDGRSFLHEYRQRPGPHAAILIMTGAGYASQRAAALDAAGSLDKPFDIQDLLAKVEELIGFSTPDPVSS